MRIRTFQGRSLEELLPQIREELGPDAVVLGQRPKVVGGIGGFFGTKVVEVTAADRMPDDQALIDLEDQMAEGALAEVGGRSTPVVDGPIDPAEAALAERFRGAMKMGRQGGVDLTDDWNPAEDAELAQEYGRVLEHAASAGFSELDVPVVDSAQGRARQAAAAAASPAPAAAPQVPAAPVHPALDPLDQARALAARTHEHMQAQTQRVEQSYATPVPTSVTGAYAPPSPRPVTPQNDHTFAASVLDSHEHVVPTSPELDPQRLLMDDLAPAPSQRVASALDSAIDLVDLRAIAALRSAVDASRRVEDGWRAEAGPEMSATLAMLAETGVDDDVAASIASTVLRHRQPFAPGTPLTQLVHDVVEETIDVRTGFHKAAGRAHRLALVGASSSGKTTVAAKIAHAYGQVGMRVGMVVILPDDPGAAILQDPRLVALGAEVRYVTNPAQASAAAEVFAGHDLVVIDTPGTTYLDRATFGHVDACLRALGADDVHVVLPLSTSSREAAHLVEAFSPLGANRMVVSRLDESRYVGQLLNFGFRLGLPMTFLSDGPRIPEDLRAASAREIAERILPPTTGSSHAS